MSTANLALLILAVILAQVAVAVLVMGYRRQRDYRTLAQREQPTPNERTSPHAPQNNTVTPAAQGEAWEGFKEFIVQRRELEDGHDAICSFYLAPTDGKPLPGFRPGQFLTFRLPIVDPLTQQPKSVLRCYSLSDQPRADYYRVSIKRVPAPPEHPELPPGLSSNYFHDQVQAGSRLQVKAPAGHFHLIEEPALPIVLIGGGIGITPMLSILNSVLEGGSVREVWLFYGVRNGREHIMKEHLQDLARDHANFHLHVCYSAPGEADVEGLDYQHRARVDIPLLRNALKLARYQFYVCGPAPMMESLVPGLQAWGVDAGDIYYESFGPATLIKHERPRLGDSTPINVTFSRSGKTLRWDPTADSLLAFAEANGIEVTSGCRAGSCGSCQTPLQSGEVDYNQQPDADVEAGHCLLCISTPKGDLVLDA